MTIAVRVFQLRRAITDEQIAASLGANVKTENGIFTLHGIQVGFREDDETFALLASRPGLQSIARNFADDQGESEKDSPDKAK